MSARLCAAGQRGGEVYRGPARPACTRARLLSRPSYAPAQAQRARRRDFLVCWPLPSIEALSHPERPQPQRAACRSQKHTDPSAGGPVRNQTPGIYKSIQADVSGAWFLGGPRLQPPRVLAPSKPYAWGCYMLRGCRGSWAQSRSAHFGQRVSRARCHSDSRCLRLQSRSGGPELSIRTAALSTQSPDLLSKLLGRKAARQPSCSFLLGRAPGWGQDGDGRSRVGAGSAGAAEFEQLRRSRRQALGKAPG
eukprot:12960362-Alexandrium_andersonii.AAC.2